MEMSSLSKCQNVLDLYELKTTSESGLTARSLSCVHLQARMLHERNGHSGNGHGHHAGHHGHGALLDRISSASDSHLDCTCCSCDWISKALLCRYVQRLSVMQRVCIKHVHGSAKRCFLLREVSAKL